jgi:hypothetical protein
MPQCSHTELQKKGDAGGDKKHFSIWLGLKKKTSLGLNFTDINQTVAANSRQSNPPASLHYDPSLQLRSSLC